MHRSTPTTTPIDVDGSQQLHRYGAEAARRAHNPEVTGSKPVAGIFQFAALSEAAHAVTTATLTGMAQRERAGLITPRSLVRIQLPVFIIRSFIRSCNAVTTAHYFTGVAQR